jgi:hypothetical protein
MGILSPNNVRFELVCSIGGGHYQNGACTGLSPCEPLFG